MFLNRETDFNNRSRAITIESSQTYPVSGEIWLTKLDVTFNETLKFGDQITQVDPGRELRLKSWWELDETLYYKNQSVKTIPAGLGGGYTEIIVENLQNPMLTYFLETDAKIMGQAGTVFISATAVILWKAKGKVRENKRNFTLTIILVFILTFIITFLIIPGIPILA